MVTSKKKERTFNRFPNINEFGLECPNCGSNCIHQGRVEVFDRCQDAEEGHHVTVDGFSLKVDRSMTNNPSARRDGILIYFSCEECSYEPEQYKNVEAYFCGIPTREATFTEYVLSIVQHKGHTYIEWLEPKAVNS